MRRSSQLRRRRACDVQAPMDGNVPAPFMKPAPPTEGPRIDDGRIITMIRDFARAGDVEGVRHLLEDLGRLDKSRARSMMQLIKFKHPDMYLALLKEEGRAMESMGDQLLDNASEPSMASANGFEGDAPMRTRTSARRRSALSELRGLRTRRMAEELDLGDDEDLEGMEGFDLDEMGMGDGEEDLDLDEMGEGGDLDLSGLDDEDLEGLEDLSGEECKTCEPGKELVCVPEEEAEEYEEEEEDESEEEEEAEGEEGEEEEEDEEGEKEDKKEKKEDKKEKDEKEEAEAEDKDDKKEGSFFMQRLLTEKELDSLKGANFELTLFNENTDDPHYVVTANGYPIAEIRQQDQSFTGQFGDLFLRSAYKTRVQEGIRVLGPVQALKELKARFYATAAYEGDVAEVIRTDVTASLERQQQEKLAELKDNFLNVATMVLEGSIKNYWGENELKAALQERMATVGINANAAIDLIEGAWRTAAAGYFQSILEKTDQLMGTHPDALKHHAEQIARMEWRHPGYETEDAIPTAGKVAQFSPSVPIATGHLGMVDEGDDEDQASTASVREGGVVLDKDYWKSKIKLSRKFMASSSNKIDAFQKHLQRKR